MLLPMKLILALSDLVSLTWVEMFPLAVRRNSVAFPTAV